MNRTCLKAFSEEIKLAALNPAEKAAWTHATNLQGEFERKSAKGPLSAADGELHRQNTERIKHLIQKRKSDSHPIPPWVSDTNASMPGGSTQGRRPANAPNPVDPNDFDFDFSKAWKDARNRKVDFDFDFNKAWEESTKSRHEGRRVRINNAINSNRFTRAFSKRPRLYAALAGGALLGGTGALSEKYKKLNTHGARQLKRDDERRAAKGGYMSRAFAKYPVMGHALLGGAMGASAAHGGVLGFRNAMRKNPYLAESQAMQGALLGYVAPFAAVSVADMFGRNKKKPAAKKKAA